MCISFFFFPTTTQCAYGLQPYMRTCGDIQRQSDLQCWGKLGSLCFPVYRHAPMLPFCFTSISVTIAKPYPHVHPTHPHVCVHSPYLSHHSTVQCILGSKCSLHCHHRIHHLEHKDMLHGRRVNSWWFGWKQAVMQSSAMDQPGWIGRRTVVNRMPPCHGLFE